jgi:hypothetical protein
VAGLEAARRRAPVARTPALISKELVTSVVKGALVSLTESGLGPCPSTAKLLEGRHEHRPSPSTPR